MVPVKIKELVFFFFQEQLRYKAYFLFKVSKKIYVTYRRLRGSYRLRKSLKKRTWKITLGAGGLYDKEWIPTDVYELDITKDSDWERFFDYNSIDAMIAEHIWEHLSTQDGLRAAKNCYKYLKPGKKLRVAVPDGYHPNPEYIRNVKVGGVGPGASDHKVLYTYRTLKVLFESAGFEVRLSEYYDEDGKFHEEWTIQDGMIYRSAKRSKDGEILLNASLIIDALKT